MQVFCHQPRATKSRANNVVYIRLRELAAPLIGDLGGALDYNNLSRIHNCVAKSMATAIDNYLCGASIFSHTTA
jgi:hypothetical protein